MAPPIFDESLLILSDVHLGNDLNDLTMDGERRSEQVDQDLASLLEHYRRAPPSGRRWRLVIAGDFIDFVGMTILPRAGDIETQTSEEERSHGLGNGVDHGCIKLRAVAARHAIVFDALARFVAEGHALTIVHGNHDVEFHWDALKEALRSLLVLSAQRTRTLSAAATPGETVAFAEEFSSRIDFAPWFYYVGGVAYIEHGHQYDTMCSTENVMAPLSPLDPKRIVRSFSDVLLRWVVRPTRGVPEYGHDKMGLTDYVMLGVRMGFRGVLQLAGRFFAAVFELFRMRRAYRSEGARFRREENERRMGVLAVVSRVGIERLRALAALQVPPVAGSIQKILASVLLDRLALALSAVGAMGVLVLTAARHPWLWPVVGIAAIAWVGAHRLLTLRRRAWFGETLDNQEALVERAGHLARLFPAAFVVMGHTHSPAMVPVAEGASTYVNVGSWHEAEGRGVDEGARYRAARTHLVIHPAPAGPTAEFLAWEPGGPRTFVSPARRVSQG